MRFAAILRLSLLGACACLLPSAAGAQIAVSQLVVDLQPGTGTRQDIEVADVGAERSYVAVEPAEVMAPGTPSESRRSDPDPERLGLLVSPARMILERGQRKLVRVAEIAPPGERERVYRLTIKPVVGPISSDQSGLKILVGYDVLVLVRPAQARPNIAFSRGADSGTFSNTGNVSVELFDGRQCDVSGASCSELPGKRLYSGAQWTVPLKPGFHAEFSVKGPGIDSRTKF